MNFMVCKLYRNEGLNVKRKKGTKNIFRIKSPSHSHSYTASKYEPAGLKDGSRQHQQEFRILMS